jgi:anti-sigma regulatory factor (Ser/Thr protein kinase)
LLQGDVADDVALLAMRPVTLAGEELHVRRPSRPTGVGEVRRVLRRWLRDNGASEADVMDVLVACSEAHTNVVRHAYSSFDGVVEIDARVEGGTVVITVKDRGIWRLPHLSTRTEGGRGFGLINALMDTVDIHSDEVGTEVEMRRQLTVNV